MPANERLYISRPIDAGQAGIKDELGYSRGGLNFDLQHIRLRRAQHPELQLVGATSCSQSRSIGLSS